MERTNKTNISKAKENVERGGSEAEIKSLLNEWRQCFIDADIDGIIEFYADDVVAYDMMPPLSFDGRDSYRGAWERANSGEMKAPWIYETKEQHILIDGDLACVHRLAKCGATSAETGKVEQGWTRHSMTLQRRDGEWLIVHDHYSVPIDMESGKGLMDLKPEAADKH